jgi:Arc/MetJ-type ribon-helix-helix transcriptional regulator
MLAEDTSPVEAGCDTLHPMTAITLPADLEAWARSEVEAGRAESVDALVADAVKERRAEIEYVRGKLDEARASLARGEGISLEEAFRQIDSWIADDEAAAEALLKAAE